MPERLHPVKRSVLALAREIPLHEVTHLQIAERAGVEISEVLEHGATSIEIAEAALDELLAYIEEELAVISANNTNEFSLVAESHRMLLEHALDQAPVYLSSTDGRLWRVMTSRVDALLERRIEFHPARLPFTNPSDLDKRMLAAYTAAGTVAAIETWLRSGDTDDLDDAVTVIFAGAPEWLFDATR